jgi:hypothetical protein
MLAARRARADGVRTALDGAFEALGHPAFAVALQEVVTEVGRSLKEPWSQGLERLVVSAARAAGARPMRVGNRWLLRGVRRRGRTVAEAVEDGRAIRAWARASRGGVGDGQHVEEAAADRIRGSAGPAGPERSRP